MNVTDVILLFLLGFAGYRWYHRGFLVSLLSILAFLIAIVIAFMFMDWGVNILDGMLDGLNGFLPYLAFILIFIATAIGISFAGKALKRLLDLTLLGSIDNLVGAILGVSLWIFGLSLLIWLTDSVGVEIPDSWTNDSVLYGKIAKIAPAIIEGTSSYIPMIKDLFESITERLQPALP